MGGAYFESRQDYILGERNGCYLYAIWLLQGSLCPICRQRITHENGWNVHHKVKKVMGAVKNYLTFHQNSLYFILEYTKTKNNAIQQYNF